MTVESAPVDSRRRWRRLRPWTARTQIIAWVLLLVLTALGVVTFVTWQLLVRAVDARMDEALRFEVQEFAELTGARREPAYRRAVHQRGRGDSGRPSPTTSPGPTRSSSAMSTGSTAPRAGRSPARRRCWRRTPRSLSAWPP